MCVCVRGTVGVKALGREEGVDGWQGGWGRLTGQEGHLGRAWERTQESDLDQAAPSGEAG